MEELVIVDESAIFNAGTIEGGAEGVHSDKELFIIGPRLKPSLVR